MKGTTDVTLPRGIDSIDKNGKNIHKRLYLCSSLHTRIHHIEKYSK